MALAVTGLIVIDTHGSVINEAILSWTVLSIVKFDLIWFLILAQCKISLGNIDKWIVSKCDCPFLCLLLSEMICSNETPEITNLYFINISIILQFKYQGLWEKKKKTFHLEAQPADKENACVDLYFKVKEESPAEQITDQIINILTGEH